MTRRHLLASAAALAGMGKVETPAAPVWMMCGRAVTGYRIEVQTTSGSFMSFEGVTRDAYNRAWNTISRLAPLCDGAGYKESFAFEPIPLPPGIFA